jgi:hypothetical protein
LFDGSVWDIARLEQDTAPVLVKNVYYSAWSIAIHPHRFLIAVGTNAHTISLIDTETNTLIRELSGHTHNIPTLNWSSDGRRLVSGSVDGQVRLWDALDDYASVVIVEYPGMMIWHTCFSPDDFHLLITAETRILSVLFDDDNRCFHTVNLDELQVETKVPIHPYTSRHAYRLGLHARGVPWTQMHRHATPTTDEITTAHHLRMPFVVHLDGASVPTVIVADQNGTVYMHHYLPPKHCWVTDYCISDDELHWMILGIDACRRPSSNDDKVWWILIVFTNGRCAVYEVREVYFVYSTILLLMQRLESQTIACFE